MRRNNNRINNTRVIYCIIRLLRGNMFYAHVVSVRSCRCFISHHEQRNSRPRQLNGFANIMQHTCTTDTRNFIPILRLTLEAIKIPEFGQDSPLYKCNARINPIRAYPLITVSYLTMRATGNLDITIVTPLPSDAIAH